MVDLFVDLQARYFVKVILSKFDLLLPPINCLYSWKLLNNSFVLVVTARIDVLSLFQCTVKSPHLVFKNKPLFPETADPVKISDTPQVFIHQIRRRQVISMAVHLCCGSAEILLRRSEEDDILNVAMNTIVMIVLLEYGGILVAQNLVSLSFSEMTFEKIH